MEAAANPSLWKVVILCAVGWYGLNYFGDRLDESAEENRKWHAEHSERNWKRFCDNYMQGKYKSETAHQLARTCESHASG